MVQEYQRLPFYGPSQTKAFDLALGISFDTPHAEPWYQFSFSSKKRHFKRSPIKWDLADLTPLVKTLLGLSPSLDNILVFGGQDPLLHPQFAETVDWLRELRKELQLSYLLNVLTSAENFGEPHCVEVCQKLDVIWVPRNRVKESKKYFAQKVCLKVYGKHNIK